MKKVSLHRDIEIDNHYNEAIKTLRTNVLFSGKNTHVIMFTSTFPDEGKSDAAYALAQSLSQIGKKVIIVDADIRKSVMAVRYNVGEQILGLSQFLCGQANLADTIYDTDVPNLHMIFAGPPSPTPAELLEEPAFKEMIDYLRANYDYVIVDTPPLGLIIDGAIVAKCCDATIMVVESGTVSYKIAQSVKEQLEKAGCRILGVILNKVDIKTGSYYGKYGRYGKYGKYGKYSKYDNYEYQKVKEDN